MLILSEISDNMLCFRSFFVFKRNGYKRVSIWPGLWTGQAEKRKEESQKCPYGLVRVSGWINTNTLRGEKGEIMKIYNLMCIHEKPCEQAEASAMPYASFDLASDQMKKEYGEVMQKLESEEVAVV